MKTGVKILLIATGVIATIGLVYWISRKKYVAPSGTPVIPGAAGSPQLTVTPVSKPNPAFPLKSGSNNLYVKELQSALGVTADGAFGAATLSALQSQFGISSIQSEDQLNSIVDQADEINKNFDLALAEQGTFAAGGVCISVYPDTFCAQINVAPDGTVTPTGTGITLSSGKYYDPAYYTLGGATKMGLALMNVTANDGTAGQYTVDPNVIFLVPPPVPVYNPAPVTDAGSGLTQF